MAMITMTMIMMTKTIVLKNDDCYNNDHVAATAAAAAYDYTRDANFNEGKVSKSNQWVAITRKGLFLQYL